MLALMLLLVVDKKSQHLEITEKVMEVIVHKYLMLSIGDNWIFECESDDKDGYVQGKT